MSVAAIATDSAWPISDLEHLHQCPCCSSASRELQVSGLRDFTMGAAPGEWAMWRCDACGCAYLDPRPTAESIGRAYAGYHTHGMPLHLAARARTLARRFKFEAMRRTTGLSSPELAYAVRHTAPVRRGARLLDIGFGAGGFLEVASWLGYVAVGIDFDPEVVANARARGFEVSQAGVPGSNLTEGQFAHVTLCNVLEHLHRPVEALEEIWRLLEPGGRLWLTQPNLGAPGAQVFGPFWRGYEAPRHLTLWDAAGLAALLTRCGFVDVRLLPADPTSHELYYGQSELQRAGYLPSEAPPSEAAAAAQAAAAAARAVAPEQAESLTMAAYRPA